MPAWLAPAIAATVAMQGELFGANNNKRTNNTNLKIAQMNNDFNERMFDKQIAYNTEMWNKQNEYNNVVNQRQRIEEGGFSPWTLMQGANAGTAQSAGGVNPPTAQGVTMQAYRPDLSPVSNAIMQYNEYKLREKATNAQIEQVHTDINYKNRMLMAELADKYASARSQKARAILDETMAGLQPVIAGSRINLETAQAETERERKTAIITENLLKQKELANFDERWSIEKAEAVARTLQYGAVTGLTKQQMRTEVNRTIHEAYKAQGQSINNRTAERMADSIVNEAYSRSYSSMSPFGFMLHYLDNN